MKRWLVFGLFIVAGILLCLQQMRQKYSEPFVATNNDLQHELTTTEHIDQHPSVLLNSANDIARVFKEARSDASKANEGFIFFRRCSENIEVLISLRAVCYVKFMELKKIYSNKLALPVVGEEVLHIVRQL